MYLVLILLCLGHLNDLFPGQVTLAALDHFHSLSYLSVISEPLILFELNLPVNSHEGLHLLLC